MSGAVARMMKRMVSMAFEKWQYEAAPIHMANNTTHEAAPICVLLPAHVYDSPPTSCS